MLIEKKIKNTTSGSMRLEMIKSSLNHNAVQPKSKYPVPFRILRRHSGCSIRIEKRNHEDIAHADVAKNNKPAIFGRF